MKAIVIDRGESKLAVSLRDFPESELMDGNVLVRVTHSTVNYKDGLAITGRAPVVRRWPMIPGIDFAGIVEESTYVDFNPGDRVILNGWGVGETHLGGYAEKARVKGDWLVELPSSLQPAQAMAIGTAGYTAMLALMAIERHGISPGDGPAIVTGAAGGVGSVAVALLAGRGFEVIASTGRMQEADYLKALGASHVIDRAELSKPARPFGRERWVAAIDSVGSHTLANVIAMTSYGGAVAACGLAGGADVATSVIPFILRGISLFGIDSVRAPKPLRVEAWDRLANELDPAKLDLMTKTINLEDVIGIAPDIVEGKVRGRLVVEV